MPELSAARKDQLRAYAKLLQAEAPSPAVKEQRLRTWDELLWVCAAEDPWFFCRTLVRSKNEHGGKDSPYEPFPDKAFLLHCVRTWEFVAAKPRSQMRVLLIPKSRQMMVSWVCMAMALWTAMTKQAQLIIVQSKKELDAGNLLGRAEGMWQRLPQTIRELVPCHSGHVHLDFPSTDSRMIGIPEGGDQIRSNTASLLICDEAAFQPDFLDAYTAALPSLSGGGMGVFVSSAAPGPFAALVQDEA